jgi:hypothetical protein
LSIAKKEEFSALKSQKMGIDWILKKGMFVDVWALRNEKNIVAYSTNI